MCYGMRCKYQDYEGECRGFPIGSPPPEDAACVEENRDINRAEREEAERHYRRECPECGAELFETIIASCEGGAHHEVAAWGCDECDYVERQDA